MPVTAPSLSADEEEFLGRLGPWEKARARWIWLTEVAQDRAEQRPPEGVWRWWFFQAGRGSGKTRAAAEWVSDVCRRYPGCRVALVGRRLDDVRQVMVEGDSGLLAVVPTEALRGGSRGGGWNRQALELHMANGSMAKGYSSEEPSNLRGPQHHFAWIDEPQDFDDARRGNTLDTTFNNLELGLRLPGKPSWDGAYRARGMATGTPKAVQLVRDIRELATITRGSTYSNLSNLDPEFAGAVLSQWQGTRLERQELLGELLDEVEGALVSHAMIEAGRRADSEIPGGSWRALRRRLVMVDPSFSGKPGSDECGICVGGTGADGDPYVLADVSGRLTPSEWGRRAVQAYIDWECDAIGYESNLVPTVAADVLLNAAADLELPYTPRLIAVPAGAGQTKVVRLERVSPLYEQGRCHHVGSAASFGPLEDQLCSWTPDDPYSPDRLDALVHLLGDKMLHAAKPARPAKTHPVNGARLPTPGRMDRSRRWITA